uniref:Uncharacterized protein n=1 Tax=Rhizophora mucronata TaxID=61149 RepID=A0A2P2LQG5_RHIMU
MGLYAVEPLMTKMAIVSALKLLPFPKIEQNERLRRGASVKEEDLMGNGVKTARGEVKAAIVSSFLEAFSSCLFLGF